MIVYVVCGCSDKQFDIRHKKILCVDRGRPPKQGSRKYWFTWYWRAKHLSGYQIFLPLLVAVRQFCCLSASLYKWLKSNLNAVVLCRGIKTLSGLISFKKVKTNSKKKTEIARRILPCCSESAMTKVAEEYYWAKTQAVGPSFRRRSDSGVLESGFHLDCLVYTCFFNHVYYSIRTCAGSSGT